MAVARMKAWQRPRPRRLEVYPVGHHMNPRVETRRMGYAQAPRTEREPFPNWTYA